MTATADAAPAGAAGFFGASALFGASLTTGPGCGLTGLPGISVGHAGVDDTGVTVIACPDGAIAAVDVRGGGPGTRETDLLEPRNTVREAHAVVLAGGSAFGLAAADGVMRGLAERGHGLTVSEDFPDVRVPIVPAAVIFDLLLGERTVPDAELGRAALDAALGAAPNDAAGTDGATAPGGCASGCVGAGTGAMAGALKGGIGQSAVRLPGGRTVAAIVAANPLGSVVDPDGRPWGDPDRGSIAPEAVAELASRFIGLTKIPVPGAGDGPDARSLNTTIGCIVTDAPLTQDQAQRLAMSGHDGMARAIRPSHLPMDGDTLFCLATGDSARDAAGDDGAESAAGTTGDSGAKGAGVSPEELAVLAAAAADAVQHAIVDAVASATGRAGVPSFAELTGAGSQPRKDPTP